MVFSDTHRELSAMKKEILKRAGIDRYFHLGDHASDAYLLEQATGKSILAVRGNNDYGDYETPKERIVEVEGNRVLLVHGNGFYVHDERETLARYAIENGCSIALYGHTHRFRDEEIMGVRLVNPGAISHPRDYVVSYAILTFDKDRLFVERVTEEHFL